MKKSSKYSIFSCQECGQQWEAHSNVEALAVAHGKETGHHITGVYVDSVVINPKSEQDNAKRNQD